MKLREMLENNQDKYITIEGFWGRGNTSGYGRELLEARHTRAFLDDEIEILAKEQCKYIDYAIKIERK